jgi:hypothetical protein
VKTRLSSQQYSCYFLLSLERQAARGGFLQSSLRRNPTNLLRPLHRAQLFLEKPLLKTSRYDSFSIRQTPLDRFDASRFLKRSITWTIEMSDAAGETLKSARQQVSPSTLHQKLISRRKHPSGAAEDYVYEEIRALTEIRLLHILPGSGHGIISCKLLPYNVSLRIDQAKCGWKNQVQYTALSYTWGDPKLACSILINGVNIRITTNLHTALLHLRDTLDTKVI